VKIEKITIIENHNESFDEVNADVLEKLSKKIEKHNSTY
jgi:hypothetical protein